MELATQSGDFPGDLQARLQQLAQRLRQPLQVRIPSTPFQVHCALKQGNLLVLCQHPAPGPGNKPPLAPSAGLPPEQVEQVFDILERQIQARFSAIVQQLDSTIVPQRSQVKLFLRVSGQKQPYQGRSFAFAPAPLAEAASPKAPLADVAPNSPLPTLPPGVTEPEPEAEVRELPSDPSTQNLPQVLAAQPSQRSIVAQRKPRSPFPSWQVLSGLGIGLAVVLGGVFAVTRPCVLGQCDVLTRAQALSQQSAQWVQAAKSEQDLQQAQQPLAEANRLLRSIPLWSSWHDEAQMLLQSYQEQTTALDQILEAEKQADAAMQQSRTVPQPVSEWQRIQLLWQDATAKLQAIPQSSSLYPLAQQHLVRDRQQQAAVADHITMEQQAQQKLAAAKKAVKLAEARQGVAQSPETWQLTRVTWQVAIDALQQIPDGTTSRTEAEQLLALYQPKLGEARDRATQEQVANKAYMQALNLAAQAKNFEAQNQWSRAVITWRNALAAAKQVPEGSLYYSQAQPLVATYDNALKVASAKLQVATALQATQRDLNQVCAGSPRRCSYTLSTELIRIQFTAAYERAVRTAFVVGRLGDRQTLGGAVNHLDSLEAALQTISNNAGIPVEVYNSDNKLIGFFNPTQ